MKASTFLPFLIIFFIGFFNSVDVKTQWIGQKLDINKVCMLDTSAGWAVGNNGNIYKIKDFEWEKVELPFFTESDFQSVHFTDINHGWVGGDNGLLLQYENNEWYIHNLNDMGLYSVRSIFFADSSMGWIAGGGNGIIKYENQQFKKYELPNWYYLNDMFFTDTSQGWAVGDEGKIFKYENGNWTQESSNTNNSLFSVYFSDENNGRAVGYNVILKFEGLQWTEEQYPEEIDYIELKSVSFTSLLNGYATGNNSRILKFNGINWLVDSTYVNYEWPNLMYVNYISSSEIWLIDSHGKIYKSDGSEWSILNEKIELSNPNDIFFTDSVNGWAIDNNYIMWQHTESGWQIFDTITDTYPYELFFTDANNGFALGGGNQYLKFDGTEWTRIPFENWNWYNINSIYFTDSIHGWAAGYNGIILKYNDSVWIEENSGTYQTLRSVFFTDTLNGWAVGDSGIILKYNGTSWERQNSPTDMDLYSIWITGQNKGWAVGESSIIIEYDGTDWTIQQIGQYEWYYLYSVFFTDSSHGWAAGYSGTLLRYDGNEWKTQNLGYHYYFQDMFFTDSLNGWLIGYNTLLHTINAGGIYLPKQESIKFVGSIKSIFDWNYDTIHVLSDIRYNGDEILTINQGSHINFHGPFSIETYNPVEFIGEESDSIYFTNCDTCTRKWESIYIYNYSSKDSSIFKYCSFKGSKDQTLYLYGSGPSSISHCLFDSLYNGLYLSNSSGGIITNSTFTNINNTGINLNNSNNFNLYNIQIKKCNTGLYFSNSSAILNNITISECLYYSANFDNSNASLINSKICNNDLYVPLYVYNSKVDVINCLIGNNRSYSNNANSIYISYSKINILNSTIVNNETTYFTGSALYFRFSNGNIVNSILWGNINNSDTSQIYIYNNNSKPNFYNCNIQGGINEIETESLEVTYNGNYIQNIDTLPLFENPTDSAGSDFNAFEANWQLQPNSPLINLGRNNFENITYPETDLNGQKRILNGIIDIGAYETHILSYEYTCDTIKGNVYWTADTIRIKNCDVLIDYNSTLHIPPGVRIEFYSQNKIIVHGSIKASGNRYNPIVFTVDDTLGFWSSDTVGWIGIEYNNNDGKMD
ncbi:MAG: right-handed parallel beta-helix repeat-containing protein, partial [Bacteroidales bacterium]|nr:right-handed parallel beta-helix repeat-containing protein [Bacteroidales bacterium]